jgi:hypothetical protein
VIDSFKAMGAIAGLMKNKERLAEATERVKARLAALRVEGEAAGGVVRVTATGEMKVVDVHVEPALASGFGADESSRLMAQKLIIEATNEALTKARDEAARILGAEMEALGLPALPGDLGKLLT